MKTALLLIDIQNDYFPGGKMELEGSVEAARLASGILKEFRQRNAPVIHIQHLSIRKGASFFIPETEGAGIHPLVEPLNGEPVIQKNYPNSFRKTKLYDYLKQNEINRLLICGMMTHMCVDATTRAAYDLEFECIVVKDACATRHLLFDGNIIPAKQVHESFLSALSSPYAKIISAEEAIRDIIEQL